MGRWTRNEWLMLATMGDRLRLARHDAQLSQEDVQQMYGIHRTYVGGSERGERNCSALMLVRFATVYGVDPGDFLKGLRHDPELWPLEPKWRGQR